MEVNLLEVEPELLASIPDPADAAGASRTEAVLLDVGPWEPGDVGHAEFGHFGLLVVDGILLRRSAPSARHGLEIVGPGDVLRPWVTGGDAADLGVLPVWHVHRRARLAILDSGFAVRVARWPAVAGEIMDRLVRRQHSLAIQLSITQTPNLQLRLRLLLWSLAGRWGRVTRDGVRVDLPLTHQLIADLAGASRPPVTTALGELERGGYILRDEAGRWLLRGRPPQESGASLRGPPVPPPSGQRRFQRGDAAHPRAPVSAPRIG